MSDQAQWAIAQAIYKKQLHWNVIISILLAGILATLLLSLICLSQTYDQDKRRNKITYDQDKRRNKILREVEYKLRQIEYKQP